MNIEIIEQLLTFTTHTRITRGLRPNGYGFCHGSQKGNPDPYPSVPVPATRAGYRYPCYCLSRPLPVTAAVASVVGIVVVVAGSWELRLTISVPMPVDSPPRHKRVVDLCEPWNDVAHVNRRGPCALATTEQSPGKVMPRRSHFISVSERHGQ